MTNRKRDALLAGANSGGRSGLSGLWNSSPNRPLIVCVSLLLLIFVTGSGAEEKLGKKQDPLTADASVTLWTANGNIVPVCWETPGYDREKFIVINAVRRTWERSGNIRFVGWHACPAGIGIGGSGSDQHVRVRITPQGDSNAGAGGSARLGMGALSSAAVNDPGVKMSFNPDGTADSGRVEYIAVHEFGHVLGFIHEQDAPGNVEGPAYCNDSVSANANAAPLTGYDRDSVMNYCNRDGNMKGDLTAFDISGVQAAYGFPPKALGRVRTGASTPSSLSICEAARQARARNSPASTGLEAQCRAAGVAGETSPQMLEMLKQMTEGSESVAPAGGEAARASGGNTTLTAAAQTANQVNVAPGDAAFSLPLQKPDPPICVSARKARARTSPAAPGLEARCQKAGGTL